MLNDLDVLYQTLPVDRYYNKDKYSVQFAPGFKLNFTVKNTIDEDAGVYTCVQYTERHQRITVETYNITVAGKYHTLLKYES